VSDEIKHVVVLMLENRSFDQMLACMRAIRSGIDGVDPSHPLCNPDLPNTNPPICQAPSVARVIKDDPNHDLPNVLRQIAGGCQGFVSDFAQMFPQSSASERSEVMGYYPHGFLSVLHQLADSFTVCDRWFSSLPGPTWPNRFFVHSGTCLGHVTMPQGVWHPNLHIYDQVTVYDRLEERGISWKIYYGDVPQSLVLTRLWQHPFSFDQLGSFFSDAAGNESKFPQFSFIEATYFGDGQNDQHPPTDVIKGEVLLAQVYNALRSNEALWSTTLFIVVYDEHGGFADHVYPTATLASDSHTEEFAFNQFGVRVPAILISPWFDAGEIRTTLDHTSLLKYLTDKWSLGPLGLRTAAADSFAVSRKSLRDDAPASIPVPQLPVTAAMDQQRRLNPNQAALLAFSQFLETKLAKVEAPTEVARRSLAAASGLPEDQGAIAAERVSLFLQYRRRGVI
jgi:phospholipase C